MVEILLGLLGLYLAIGVGVGIPFVFRGVNQIDPAAKEGTWGFRLLILPGSVALWPLILGRWRAASGQPPMEQTPHKIRAVELKRAEEGGAEG